MKKRLTSLEEQELVLQNIGLVYYWVNKFVVAPSNYDDMISIGIIGLIKAAANFDKTRNKKFASYAAKCIRNELFLSFRDKSFEKKEVFLEDIVKVNDNGKELYLKDLLSSSSNSIYEDQDEHIFEILINLILNLLEKREILIMLYKISGYRQKEIAKQLNLSQPQISRLEKTICKKIKCYYERGRLFKGAYFMSVEKDLYRVSITLNDNEKSKKEAIRIANDITVSMNSKGYKLEIDNNQIIIYMPRDSNSFPFLATIINGIGKYIANES